MPPAGPGKAPVSRVWPSSFSTGDDQLFQCVSTPGSGFGRGRHDASLKGASVMVEFIIVVDAGLWLVGWPAFPGIHKPLPIPSGDDSCCPDGS